MATAVHASRPVARAGLAGGALAGLLAAGHVANDAVAGSLAALLPTLQARFGLAEGGLVLLVAAFSLSAAATQPLFGAAADRLGGRSVAVAGLAVSAGLLSLVGVAGSVPLLFGLLLVGGLGSAAFHPAATSVALAGGGHRGLAVSLFGAGGMLGVALGPVLVLGVVGTLGTGALPWLMAPGLALAAVLYASAPAAGPRAARTERFLDTGLLAGPVGALAVVGILSNVAFVTFTNAVPLWLVAGGVPGEGALIGWTLAAFSGAAALGGLGGGALSTRVPRRLLGAGSMLLALPALLAVHALAPGTGPFFAAVALAGALLNASTPLLLVTAQDLAPRAVGTASGLFMGLTVGVAGLLYVPIGRLQEAIGLGPAMAVSYLALLPAAALAWRVLGRVGGTVAPARGALAGAASAEARCACGSAGTFAGASDQRARRLLENPR